MTRESVSVHESGCRIDLSRTEKGKLQVVLEGTVSLENVEIVREEVLARLTAEEPGSIVAFDLSRVEAPDSAAAGMLLHLKRTLRERGAEAEFAALDSNTGNLFSLLDPEKALRITEGDETRAPFVQRLGETTLELSFDFSRLVQFIGRVTISIVRDLSHPWRIRWSEVGKLIGRTGSDALPIVALMSMLVGLVTAFSSAIQLRQFGADIFIANLVGLGMTREMGPLMAAILLTGRSGSAFAAEIGTMKISEEIDALTVMRIPPMEYLVMPRIIAVMIALPLLTIFADLFGIFGGILVAVAGLDLSPVAFLQQLHKAIDSWDVFSGVIKAFFFGILVAGVGCFRGMETRGGALDVGRSTTSSVVSGIFLIVLADSVFVIIFHYLGLG